MPLPACSADAVRPTATRRDRAGCCRVMASRGPDGTHTWTRTQSTFGHGALHATPESVDETMPLVDRATGNVIVADVRLDNRGELIEALRLRRHPPADSATGGCCWHAYRKAGARTVSTTSSATSRLRSGTSGVNSCSWPATTSVPGRSPTTAASVSSRSHRTPVGGRTRGRAGGGES